LESTTEILARLRQAPWTGWEIVQVSVARGVPIGPRLMRFDPLNPVWVTAAQLEKK
jgi:precorrin-6B methylase 2